MDISENQQKYEPPEILDLQGMWLFLELRHKWSFLAEIGASVTSFKFRRETPIRATSHMYDKMH